MCTSPWMRPARRGSITRAPGEAPCSSGKSSRSTSIRRTWTVRFTVTSRRRCGSSDSRTPFTGWSPESSSPALAVTSRSSGTTTNERSHASSRRLLLRLLFLPAGVVGFLLRGLFRFLLFGHRRPHGSRGLKPFAFDGVRDSLDFDLHAKEKIGADGRPRGSRFGCEELRVHLV